MARLLRTKECVHCYIVDVDLRGHDLRGVKLEDTALHGNLRGANLTGARIMRSSLGGDLSGIDLREAKVFELSLNVANGRLSGARLDGLDLRTMRRSECTDWTGASLRGANLQALKFGGMCG
ncbi:MAG TPA: pentapeptide repeat-containing protein, partial [Polyangiaceae bacterium]|nr:pentapeptide repeat-containing protein [Polyangiaceae bacterium]